MQLHRHGPAEFCLPGQRIGHAAYGRDEPQKMLHNVQSLYTDYARSWHNRLCHP